MTWQEIIEIGTDQYKLTDENWFFIVDEDWKNFIVPGVFVEQDTDWTEISWN